jgi:hypothetical protein
LNQYYSGTPQKSFFNSIDKKRKWPHVRVTSALLPIVLQNYF